MAKETGIEELISETEDCELEELAPLFNVLSRRVFEHRLANSGFVPLPIYPAMVGFGGVYVSVEVILRLVDEDGEFRGFLLKMREEDDQGWKELWHIPGVAARMTDGTIEPFERLAGEIFGQDDASLMRCAKPIGVEIHAEFDERPASCWTLVYVLDIGEMEELQGGTWRLFSFDQLGESGIVDHHRNTLRWASNPNRPFFVDLR